MAFRRQALEAINGFDPQYHRAGDDVDICWRLQHEGLRITFAPGAFVWHHRRPTPRTYLRQQAGYGEAEALLQVKHPDKFNGRGNGKWGGMMYGATLGGLQVATPIIYRGIFGTGMFQCLYQPGAAHWIMLPSTLEWQVAAVLLGLSGALVWPFGWTLGVGMLALSVLVAGLQAGQARPVPVHQRRCAQFLIAMLCYAQPLVRSWARYRTRLSWHRAPESDPALPESPQPWRLWTGSRAAAYWSETGKDRTELLMRAIEFMDEHRWGKVLDTGWWEWDVAVNCNSSYPRVAMAAAALIMGLFARAWVRGLTAATRVMALFHDQAHQLHMIDCTVKTQPRSGQAVPLNEVESGHGPGGHAKVPADTGRPQGREACVPAYRAISPLDSPSPSEVRAL
jgi:hypothetical protein